MHKLRVANFAWGKMRTATWETALQVSLRNCSKEVEGGKSIYMIVVKGEFSAIQHLFYRRCSASHEELMSP